MLDLKAAKGVAFHETPIRTFWNVPNSPKSVGPSSFRCMCRIINIECMCTTGCTISDGPDGVNVCRVGSTF